MPRPARASTHVTARVRAWFGLSQTELALYLGVSPMQVSHLNGGSRALSAGVLAALLPLVQQLPPEAELLAALAPPPGAAPAAPATPPPALAPGSPPPEAAALALRRRECLLHAARLRTQAEALAQQAIVAARWAAALPALLAALPPAEDTGLASGAPTEATPTAEATASTAPTEATPTAEAAAPDPSAEPTAPAEATAPPETAAAAADPIAFDRPAWLRGWLARRACPLPPEAATRYHLLLARAAAHEAEAAALAAAEAAA